MESVSLVWSVARFYTRPRMRRGIQTRVKQCGLTTCANGMEASRDGTADGLAVGTLGAAAAEPNMRLLTLVATTTLFSRGRRR